MSNYDINSTPALVKRMIENSKKASEKYFAEHADSLIPPFEQELRNLGFQFEISEQVKQFLPKHKKRFCPLLLNIINRQHMIMRKIFLSAFFIIGVLKR